MQTALSRQSVFDAFNVSLLPRLTIVASGVIALSHLMATLLCGKPCPGELAILLARSATYLGWILAPTLVFLEVLVCLAILTGGAKAEKTGPLKWHLGACFVACAVGVLALAFVATCDLAPHVNGCRVP